MTQGCSVSLWRLNFDGAGAVAFAAAPPFEHPSEVCSAEWDPTGVTLATAAMDGRVRLWAANLLGDWAEQGTIGPRAGP